MTKPPFATAPHRTERAHVATYMVPAESPADNANELAAMGKLHII